MCVCVYVLRNCNQNDIISKYTADDGARERPRKSGWEEEIRKEFGRNTILHSAHIHTHEHKKPKHKPKKSKTNKQKLHS